VCQGVKALRVKGESDALVKGIRERPFFVSKDRILVVNRANLPLNWCEGRLSFFSRIVWERVDIIVTCDGEIDAQVKGVRELDVSEFSIKCDF